MKKQFDLSPTLGNWLTLTLGVMIMPIWAIVGWLISAPVAHVVGLILMMVNITIIVMMMRQPPTAQYPRNIWWVHLALTVALLVCLPAGTFLLTSTYGAMSGVSKFLAEWFYGTFIKPFPPMPTYVNPGWALDPKAYESIMNALIVGSISAGTILQTAQCLSMTSLIPKGRVQWWKHSLWILSLPIMGTILQNIMSIFMFFTSTVARAIAGSLPADFGPFDWIKTAFAACFSIVIVVTIGIVIINTALRKIVKNYLFFSIMGAAAVWIISMFQMQSAATSITPIANAQFGISITQIETLLNGPKTLMGEVSDYIGNDRYVCAQPNANIAINNPIASFIDEVKTPIVDAQSIKQYVRDNSSDTSICRKSKNALGYNTQTNLFYMFFVASAAFISQFFLGDKFFWVIPSAAAKVAENLGAKAPRNYQVDKVALFQGVFVYILINALVGELLYSFDTISSVFGEAITSGLISPPKTKGWIEVLQLILQENKEGKLLLGFLFFKWGFLVPAGCAVLIPMGLGGIIRTSVEAQYEAINGPLVPNKPAAPAANSAAPAAKPAAPAANSAAQAAKPVAPADKPAAQDAKHDKDLFGTGGFF